MNDEKIQILDDKIKELESHILNLLELQNKSSALLIELMDKSQLGFSNLKQEQSEIIANILQNMDTNQKAFLGLANRIAILENK